MLRSNRFALEIIVIGVYIYDNGSPALMGWLAFHAIVVIVFLLCFLVLWKINLLSLSLSYWPSGHHIFLLFYHKENISNATHLLQHVDSAALYNLHYSATTSEWKAIRIEGLYALLKSIMFVFQEDCVSLSNSKQIVYHWRVLYKYGLTFNINVFNSLAMSAQASLCQVKHHHHIHHHQFICQIREHNKKIPNRNNLLHCIVKRCIVLLLLPAIIIHCAEYSFRNSFCTAVSVYWQCNAINY